METSRVLAGRPLTARRPIAAGIAGDDLAALYGAHAASLYRYLLTLLQSAEEAEDALGEVFVGLARQSGRTAIRDCQAYLFRAARNHAIQALRTRKRRREEQFGDSWIAVEECQGLQREVAIDIERALRRLPVEQREVLVLKLSEGLTLREIAGLLGIPANTAGSRYRLAMKRLRNELIGGDEHV
jgi:RNA polymerase sigma-70 factor (ECF subfamily)